MPSDRSDGILKEYNGFISGGYFIGCVDNDSVNGPSSIAWPTYDSPYHLVHPINSHRDVNRPIWRRCMDDEYTRDDLGVKFTLNNRRLDNTHAVALISNFPLSEWNEHCTEFYTRNINIFESEERNRE